MDKLPKKWCIRASTEEEAIVIAKYADPLNRKYNGASWNEVDSLNYYLVIKEGKYYEGSPSKCGTLLSFEQFERLVLNKSNEPTYEIY